MNEPDNPDRSATVLVVDDNPGAREAMEALLLPEGYRVLEAADGAAALELARRERPDLMLLDVMMPGMDGFEVCRRLRETAELAEMPVVMVTALEDRGSRLRGLEVGADDFLSKPLNRQELRGRVRAITRLNRYRKLLDRQAALDYQASHDPATGLPNRARLLDALQEALREARPFALIAVGMDGLQDLVESLGHDAAERLVPLLAQRLRTAFQVGDVLARTGSREFTILLREPGGASLDGLVTRLQALLSEPLDLDGRQWLVNGNLGICCFPGDGDDAATLLQHVSMALNRAAQLGWYAYDFFSEQVSGAVRERIRLQADLHQALLQEALSVAYQPQVDARDGRVVGVEALVRWHHPQLGWVSPALFIPIAEDTGLVRAVGRFVLRQACRLITACEAKGLAPVRVGVNVSAVELRDARFVDSVRAILAETDTDGRRLELEITESVLVPEAGDGDPGLAVRVAELKALGCSLALDDFGTGYSSLRYLKRFPVDKLKIDRSFINGLPDDPEDRALTRAVIALARSFSLQVIAEGVESAAQRDCLLAEGCALIQGYHYSQPLAAEDLLDYLAASAG